MPQNTASKTVSEVFHIDKPRYTGENWRVVVRAGSSVINHGFRTEEAAETFRKEQ
jgi:hypothetical protein